MVSEPTLCNLNILSYQSSSVVSSVVIKYILLFISELQASEMEFFFETSYNLHLDGGGKTVVAGKLAPEIKDGFKINFNSKLL